MRSGLGVVGKRKCLVLSGVGDNIFSSGGVSKLRQVVVSCIFDHVHFSWTEVNPTLVPEWLRTTGSVSGGGNSTHHFASSSSHSGSGSLANFI